MEGDIKGMAGVQFDKTKVEFPVTGNTSWLIGKTKKLALVGCSDSRHLAPFAFDPAKPEDAWEVWGVNNGYADIPRWTRWFEIHPILQKGDGKFYRRKQIVPGILEYALDFRGSGVEDYMKTLAQLDCPIYMQRKWDIIPKSVEYPIKEIIEKFGNYFTNTISYQIALGIMEGFQEIACYGVDMATGSEYGPQRPSCEFFLGIAAGLGIKITIPPQADLLKTRFLYAFQEREQTAYESKIQNMLNSMIKRKNKAAAMIEQGTVQMHQYTGAIEAVREAERVWSNMLTKKDWKDPW